MWCIIMIIWLQEKIEKWKFSQYEWSGIGRFMHFKGVITPHNVITPLEWPEGMEVKVHMQSQSLKIAIYISI